MKKSQVANEPEDKVEIFFKNHEQIQQEMAGKTKEVEVSYIDKLAKKSQISPNLAEKMRLISETRYTNLMKRVSGPDKRELNNSSDTSINSGSALKKARLEIRPNHHDEETDRSAMTHFQGV